MSIGPTYPQPTSRPQTETDTTWDAPSPTDSESSETHTSPLATSHTAVHSAPSSPTKMTTSLPKTSPPNRPAFTSRTSRPRGLGLTPMSTNTSSLPLGTGALPKAQPLSRALFARMANDTPHAGMTAGSKKKAGPKLIVPTKAFKTTFELDLSASELARR